jgi:type II secretory ATPase GspE/PulE/Tfp pilus assembly ATPase PilB-like protein
MLLITDQLRELIIARRSATELLVVARKDGLKLMREDGWSKVLAGMTTVEEVVRVTKTDASAVV